MNNKLLVSICAVTLTSCQQIGSAPKLQAHLASAQTSSTQTGQKINSIRGHLETADYKGSRAQELLNKGVDK